MVYLSLFLGEDFAFELCELCWDFVDDFECGQAVLSEEEAAKWAGDGFVGFVDLFEESFGGLVVLEGLFVGV